MSTAIVEALETVPVVPLLNAPEAAQAVAVAGALAAGGLRVIEVVLRSPRAIDCLAAVAQAHPELLVGAGTVLDVAQARGAIASGARFLVSPGLDEAVVEFALERGVAVFPGVATATEAQRAWNLGLRVLKFFPAELAGGPAMLRALADVFPGLRFFATGGIAASHLGDYLSLSAVLAVGGSWLVPADALAAGDHARIRALAREAVDSASALRARRRPR